MYIELSQDRNGGTWAVSVFLFSIKMVVPQKTGTIIIFTDKTEEYFKEDYTHVIAKIVAAQKGF